MGAEGRRAGREREGGVEGGGSESMWKRERNEKEKGREYGYEKKEKVDTEK